MSGAAFDNEFVIADEPESSSDEYINVKVDNKKEKAEDLLPHVLA